MDTFKEFIVKKELTGGEKLSRFFIGVAAVALGGTFFMFTLGTTLQVIGLVAAALCLYGGWQLIVRFFVEYEYILTNFDLDIDKIVNQSSRKRLCTIDLHKVTEIGEVTGEFAVSEEETVVRASAFNPELDDYYLRFDHKDHGKTVLIFTPSIEILELIKSSCPRRAANKPVKK